MTFVLLAGLVAWQREFIIAGILAHVHLNLVIIGVFLFGSVLNTRNLINLRSDVVAINALRFAFEDAKEREFSPLDEAELRERCLKPGVVYKSSELLGPVFDLTLEELLRSKQMRISVTTMQNLIGAIDGRVAHHKTLTNYLSSLCIFLGLIGTFIGLMEMVGSVGGIIGGIAGSDANSSETMRNLLKNLEAPLTGMASGFSASLFGLFGSLMLGIGGRFVSVATHAIREEFEHWLAGVSQIESEGGQAAGGGGANSRHLSYLLQRLASALRDNTERLEKQIEVVERAGRQLDRAAMAEQQAIMALSRVEHLRAEVASLREDQAAATNAIRYGMLDGFERLSRIVQEQNSLARDDLSKLAAGQAHGNTALAQLAAVSQQFAQSADEQHRIVRTDLARLTSAHGQGEAVLGQLASAVQRSITSADEQRAATSAEISKLSSAHVKVESAVFQLGAILDRSLRLAEESRDATLAEVAKLAAAQTKTEVALAEIGVAQDRAANVRDERQQAATAEIARLADVQTQANSLLIKIAAAQAAQPEQGTVTAVVTQVVTAAVSQLAQVMNESIRAISHEISRLAEEQQRTTAAISQTPEDVFKREVAELGRVLHGGINAGMMEVAQTLEATLAAQTEALRDIAVARPKEAPANSAHAARIS